METIYFDNVTLLITHYNRSASLERLLTTFKKMNVVFADIIVSDDCSKSEHIDRIKSLHNNFDFKLITTPKNGGLGNNINKGQDEVKTAYTLYVQEDFEPKPEFTEHFKDALSYMDKDQELDIVRFYAYFKYPYLKDYGKGYSEMIFKPQLWANNHLKFYVYSDHPHLKRSTFSTKFGRYREGIKSDVIEYLMALSFVQKKGKGLFFNKFNDLFWQKNSSDEPSTINRKSWRESRNPLFLAVRKIYLLYKLSKWTFDYRFKKK